MVRLWQCWKIVLLTFCFTEWIATSDCHLKVESRLQARRWKRQDDTSSTQDQCSGDSFQCNNGDCVDQLTVCDGGFNCQDESDETAALCQEVDCPAYAFRCTYGACIDMMSKCDGYDDCADRSDETLPECARSCGDEEFECVGDDQCLDDLLVCDGKKDCDGGSDESPGLCANASCPAYAFRCKYGGCIDLNNICDGKADCTDSSDEAPAFCKSQTIVPPRGSTSKPSPTLKPGASVVTNKNSPGTSARPPTATNPTRPSSPTVPTASDASLTGSGCRLPEPPLNGMFAIGGCAAGDPTPLCRAVPGTTAPQSVVLLNSCNTGFAVNGNTFSVCQGNSSWSPALPSCVAKSVACPELIDVSVEISCTRAGRSVNCSLPMAVGTEARLKCNAGYVLAGEPNYRKVTCQAGGVWDRPIFTCIPDCGKRNPNGRPFISNGEVAQIGEYPWHAGVYKSNASNLLTQVCGGTLITPKLVISAAHCFWDEGYSRKHNKDMFKIAVGKFHRDWYTDDSEMQRHDVQNVIVDERYRGRKRNFQFDIAIVQLQNPAELTWAVNTVCVDWDNEFERFQLATGQNGTVTGWGITEVNQPSEVLKSVVLPYVELFPTCYNLVAETFQPYLTTDKFCAGFTNNRTSVCPGDSGGGLVFQHSTSKRYYLRGIVSVGSKPETSAEKCYTQALTAFSKFSESLKWVEDYQHV